MYNCRLVQIFEFGRFKANRKRITSFFRFYLIAIFIVEGNINGFYYIYAFTQFFLDSIINVVFCNVFDFHCSVFRESSLRRINNDLYAVKSRCHLLEVLCRISFFSFVLRRLFVLWFLLGHCRFFCISRLGRLLRFACLIL